MKNPLAAYLSRYPLSDRATVYYDGRAAFMFGIFNGLAIPLVGVVGRKLGMDSAMLAVLSGSVFLGLLLNLWFGHLSDRGDKAAFVFWPNAAARLLVGLAALVPTPLAFLAAMGSYNVLSSLGGPAYSSMMRTNYSDRWRGKAMGDIRIMIQVVSALCAAFAGWFLEILPGGYRIIFPIAAVAGVWSSLLFRRVKPRDKRAVQERSAAPRPAATSSGGASFRESFAFLARDRRFLAFQAIFFVMGFADKIILPLEPIRLVDELGMGYGAAGFILGTLPFAAAILGYYVLSRIADRTDPLLLLIATVLLYSFRFANVALATGPYQIIPGAVLNGIANAGWDLMPLFTIFLFAERSRLALYMGFHNTLVGIRGLLGPVLGTWLYAGMGMRIKDAYWIAFAVAIAGAILLTAFWLSFRRGPRAARSS